MYTTEMSGSLKYKLAIFTYKSHKLTLYLISGVKLLQGIPANHTTKNGIVFVVIQISSFVVLSVLVMGYVKKIK